jgi:GT2 family glycosyltransferase
MNINLSSNPLVEIGITTKNRWDDLQNALTRVAAFGLGNMRILIIDDGSDFACPFDVASICPSAELKRFSESQGLIVRRNQLAREMKSKYYLSLDDDSYPVSGSLDEAVRFAEDRGDLLCLTFPIYNPVNGLHQVKSLRDEPYRVKTFIGCGHLLHRERFLEIGGYCEELVHFGEESELAARAFQKMLCCYHFPSLKVHHVESNAGRNWRRMDFYGARNNVLWNDWFMPRGLRLIKQSRTLASRALLLVRTRRLAHLQGQIAGIGDVRKYRSKRNLMSFKLYEQWKSLPSC